MAPIILNDYSWSQNESIITVYIPFKGNIACKPDVCTFKNYIKVSSPPFLFEVFLLNEIDEDASKCTITNNEIIFELQKTQPETWKALGRELDKHEKVSERKKISEFLLSRAEEERTLRRERLRKLQNVAVHEQIDLDTRNRSTVEEIKNIEKNRAMSELEELKQKQLNDELSNKRNIMEISSREVRSSATVKPAIDSKKLTVPSGNKQKKTEPFQIPLVRQSGTIQVHFSSREFPTPTRESLQEEEKQFLSKQMAARRATGFVSEDLRPEECNPVWLKNKGDGFYKDKNYLGAISAYSHAIKLGSALPALYSNRAAAHLALGNLHKALDDCSMALELLTPHVASNAEARAKAHARRGAILCRLGLPAKSLPEYEEAVRLRPDDDQLRADYENAKRLAEENSDSDE